MPAVDEDQRREAAFLALIRYSEAGGHERTDTYTMNYGNHYFSNMATHPRKSYTRWGHSSDAAGAYGIKSGTYDDAVRKGVAHNFYPPSQDAVALWLIERDHALDDIHAGRLDVAFSKLGSTWSSLPTGRAQEVSESEAVAYFWKQLGEKPQ